MSLHSVQCEGIIIAHIQYMMFKKSKKVTSLYCQSYLPFLRFSLNIFTVAYLLRIIYSLGAGELCKTFSSFDMVPLA